ncbi:toxoplasma gondii family C protein [Toxoplasma gondii VAND]|uniref:Toxoplasma gondii family C protein n=1 Tax=Toxoplasma gondii VAND TaxID=933077 RepID=A0A086PTW5_TOXGO|nr:toxoplasma gondii family C protein [Toxoplasma gondii VAND]
MRAQFYSLASIMLAVLLGTIFLNSGRNLRKATTPASIVRMQIAMHDDGRLEAQGLDIRRSLRTIHARDGLHLMCVVPIFMDPSPPGYSGVLDVRKVVDAHNTKLLYGSEPNESSLPEMKRDMSLLRVTW